MWPSLTLIHQAHCHHPACMHPQESIATLRHLAHGGGVGVGVGVGWGWGLGWRGAREASWQKSRMTPIILSLVLDCAVQIECYMLPQDKAHIIHIDKHSGQNAQEFQRALQNRKIGIVRKTVSVLLLKGRQ